MVICDDMALKTLFYGLDAMKADLKGRVLFINAKPHSALAALADHTICVQWFKPYYDALREHETLSRIETLEGEFDTALLLIPKNMTEARYLIAQAFTHLKAGGVLYCACENKAGGTRLQKILQQFNADIVQQISKHKSRFIACRNEGVNSDFVARALKEGCIQAIDKTGFMSQSGIYGWDKIDKGSALLLQYIPQDLKGRIADFGCGYGYLLQHILQHNKGIKTAYAIDADARALECARQNLSDGRVEYLWADLTKSEGIPTRLDAIIMNPPFHEGKKTDSDIGIAFIQCAAASLKRNGALYMVANNQLPYEAVLKDSFHSYELLAQHNGFKVFKAVV